MMTSAETTVIPFPVSSYTNIVRCCIATKIIVTLATKNLLTGYRRSEVNDSIIIISIIDMFNVT